MSLIKAIVYSNIWIALGASSYLIHSYLMLEEKVNFPFMCLVFFATLFSYNFQRLIRLDVIENKSGERLVWMEKYNSLLKGITATSFVISGIIALYYFSFKDLLFSVPAFILVVFYASFFTKSRKGLRDLPFIKIILIALVWAFVLGVYPVLIADSKENIWLVFIDKFCFILAITIPFDIRDLNFDKSHQKTIPMVFGVIGAKVLAVAFLLLSLYINLKLESNILITMLFYVIALFLVIYSNKNKSELYYSGLIDGLLLLSPLIFI